MEFREKLKAILASSCFKDGREKKYEEDKRMETTGRRMRSRIFEEYDN